VDAPHDELFEVRRYPITLLTLHVVPFSKSASLSSRKRRQRQETGKAAKWFHPEVRIRNSGLNLEVVEDSNEARYCESATLHKKTFNSSVRFFLNMGSVYCSLEINRHGMSKTRELDAVNSRKSGQRDAAFRGNPEP
jgi:hypothetical protein